MVQTYSDGKYIYLVDLMFMYVNNGNTKSKKISTKKLYNQLSDRCWANHISPIEVIRDPDISAKDWIRINNADLRYPIMIDGRIDQNHNFNIVDGMHRLSKTYIMHKKSIRAYIFSPHLMEKFIVGRSPNDYDIVENLSKKDIEKIYIKRFINKSDPHVSYVNHSGNVISI